MFYVLELISDMLIRAKKQRFIRGFANVVIFDYIWEQLGRCYGILKGLVTEISGWI